MISCCMYGVCMVRYDTHVNATSMSAMHAMLCYVQGADVVRVDQEYQK